MKDLNQFTTDTWKNTIAYKTLISEELLSNGFLASNSLYVCIEHTNEI